MVYRFVVLFTLLLAEIRLVVGINAVTVVVTPSEKEISFGSSITLTCKLEDDSSGGSITWNYPSNIDMETIDIGDTLFTITSMTESNVGEYSCTYFRMKGSQIDKGTGTSVITIKPETPGKPQELTISAFSEDTVSLEWEAGTSGYADTLYYKLEMMKDDLPWSVWRKDISGDALSYTGRGLPVEHSYKFRISQVSKGGESEPSDPTTTVYLYKTGAVTIFPNIVHVEVINSTALRVIWDMLAFSDVVTEWYVEYRLKALEWVSTGEGEQFRAIPVPRDGVSQTISDITKLQEASTYEVRMYCRNDIGRGPPSPVTKETTKTTEMAAPSAPAQNVKVTLKDPDIRELEIKWAPPPLGEVNGNITGYQIHLYDTEPSESNTKDPDVKDIAEETTILTMYYNKPFPCWVAVAAKTEVGIGPFSSPVEVALPAVVESPSTKESGAIDEIMNLFKQPWIIAIIGLILLILIVMISIIACRQQKLKRRKLEQQQHAPFLKPYGHSSSMNSSTNGQFRMGRDDGHQYEKLPNDSRNNTPHGSSRSFDGRIFDNRSTPGTRSFDSRNDVSQGGGGAGVRMPNSRHGSQRSLNSYIDNRMPPTNYCPSNLSMDSHQYSMSQNSSIDDLASTIPSVTYSIPNTREGYKVVNPTHNDKAGQVIPVAKVPPKAKEHDPNSVKPKVYGNITVKEWREQQRKKTPHGGDANSDTSLLSSFGRGSIDAVSVSGSSSEEGSDIEKYLEEDYSPRNSGYIEDDLIDVARMGMSRSPPEDSTFLNPNNRAKNHPPIAADNTCRQDDNTSIESDMYMRCEAAPNTVQPVNIYNLNGGVSEADD